MLSQTKKLRVSDDDLKVRVASLFSTGQLTKTTVGLGNADNTSDTNKPVSSATQTALNSKQDTLVSGTNIKTINSSSLLGTGDLVISSVAKEYAHLCWSASSITGSGTSPGTFTTVPNVVTTSNMPSILSNPAYIQLTVGNTYSIRASFLIDGPNTTTLNYALTQQSIPSTLLSTNIGACQSILNVAGWVGSLSWEIIYTPVATSNARLVATCWSSNASNFFFSNASFIAIQQI